jgi:hypothetical protein
VTAARHDRTDVEQRRLRMLVGAALAAVDDCHRRAVASRDWELGQATATAQLALHDALRLTRRPADPGPVEAAAG